MYWFARRPLHGLAVFRIAIGILLFVYFLKRFRFVTELYSNESFHYVLPFFDRFNFPLFPPETAQWIVMGCLVLTLVFAAGLFTRWVNALLILFIGYLGSLESMYTAGCFNLLYISTILIFFAPSGQYGSVDYFLWLNKEKRTKKEIAARKTGPVWVQRLIVVQVAIVYLAAAFYKSAYAYGWYTGNHLKMTFLDPFFGQMPLGVWLTGVPWAMELGGTLMLFWEFFIAVFLLIPQFAAFVVITGSVFHILILLTFNLTWVFSFTMFAHYILVFPPERWQKWIESASETLKKAKEKA